MEVSNSMSEPMSLGTGDSSDTKTIERPSDSPTTAEKPCNIGHHARQLTAGEIEKLKQQDTRIVSDFKQMKLEHDAEKSWDLFYKRNKTNFYKDRHWTTREFQELSGSKDGDTTVVLECGCGVGNFLFPVLEENPNIFFYACDFSKRAVQFVKDNPLYSPERCLAFQCDLTKDDLSDHVPPSSVDIVSLIFVLSAIHPEKMVQALKNIHKVLTPGGCVIFRDYGLYDHAMIRFGPGQKLQDKLYVRQDNTRAYYFSEEKMAEVFEMAGFHVEKNEYILRETVNKKEGINVPRVFIQGKFVKRLDVNPGEQQ